MKILIYVKVCIFIIVICLCLLGCYSQGPDDVSSNISFETSESMSMRSEGSSLLDSSIDDSYLDIYTIQEGLMYGTFEKPNPLNKAVHVAYTYWDAVSGKEYNMDYNVIFMEIYKNQKAKDKALELGVTNEPHEFYDYYTNLELCDVYLAYVIIEYNPGSDKEDRSYFGIINKRGEFLGDTSVFRIENELYSNEIVDNMKEGWVSMAAEREKGPFLPCYGVGTPSVAPGIMATFYFSEY